MRWTARSGFGSSASRSSRLTIASRTTRCSVIAGSIPPIQTCRSELFSKRSAYDGLNSAAGEAESVLIFRKQAEWQSATRDILERAGQYVLEYEEEFQDIAADEKYTQWTRRADTLPIVTTVVGAVPAAGLSLTSDRVTAVPGLETVGPGPHSVPPE